MFYSLAKLKRCTVEEQAQRTAEGRPRPTLTIFGEEPTTHDVFGVLDVDRYSGTYILGTQGNGKSGLIENLIWQDVRAERSVIVIDPHGDLIDHCLAQLPVWAIPKAYVLDLEDEAYPFGVNLFAHGRLETDTERTQVVDRIMNVFELLWADVLSQQNLPRYVRAAIHVLLDNRGSTLVDMYELLLDQDVRLRLLKPVTDPTVKKFWAQFNKLTPAKQSAAIQPLINRLEALFMGRALVRNVVGQKVTTISFRRAIEDRELIFIKLPIKTLKQDAELIGTMLLSQLAASIFSFTDLPDNQRPGVSLYVDEFQHFSTPTFAELFTEGRKFGVRLTVAHQYRNQLTPKLQEATMTARTKVVFQTTPEDGREMAHLFPDAGGEFEISPHATSYLLDHPEQFPDAVQTFIKLYLRPLANTHGRITIQNPEDDIAQLLNHGRMKKPRENHPFPYLDGLFKEVMRTGNPHVTIPHDAVAGFADCGRGFHQALRGMFTPYHFKPDACLPPAYLAANGQWKRPPENAREQLLHYLFHLRLTLAWLATHPVGSQKNASVTDVGRMISTLPRRHAFIRSGNDGGVIRTLDTPEADRGETLLTKLERIRAQSRVKYAHPRNQVEHTEESESSVKESVTMDSRPPLDDDEPLLRPVDDDAAPPRWEEVA